MSIFTKSSKKSMKVRNIYQFYLYLVYFLVNGLAGYVIPKYENKVFLNILAGDPFGLVDLGNESSFLDQEVTQKHL